jgi:hypothetical protein
MSPEAKDRSVPFDPSSGSGPDGVLLPPADGGEVVALLVDASVRGDLWGERAAVALAREWAARGRKVVLVDGDVETPSLHELLRVPNLEGLADAILYGASLERVEITPPGESFRFVASGTVVADPAGLRGSHRWVTFLDQLRSRGEVALLFLPTGGSGSSLLAGQGDRILRMARPGSPPPEGLPPALLLYPEGAPPHSQAGVKATDNPPAELHPTQPSPTGTPLTNAPPDPSARGAGGSAPSDASGTPGGASVVTAPSDSASAPVRPPPSRPGPRPRPGGGRQKALLILLLVLVVLVVLAAVFGLVDIPGLPATS